MSRYRAENRERLAAADRDRYWVNPDASRAKKRDCAHRRRLLHPEMIRAEDRARYHVAKAKRLSVASAVDRRRAIGRSHEFFDALRSAVPSHWPFSDDVIGDLTLAYYSGKITLAGIPDAVQILGRRYRNEEYKTLSLDEPLFEDGPSRLDMLVGHNPLEEDDPADEE